MCYLRLPFGNSICSKFAEQSAGTDRIYIGDTGVFCFDNISAEDVKLFLLKQTCKLLLSLRLLVHSMHVFYLAGSAQQAQQSTHLADGLRPS